MSPQSTRQPNRDAYVALECEEKIWNFKGLIPWSERQILASNLGELLMLAGQKGLSKSQIVINSGIKCPGYAPVNALANYSLLPAEKSRRKSKARLKARPQDYLSLALAAADEMKMPREEAILRLTDGSNEFSTQGKLQDDIFSTAQHVWLLLRAKLAVIVERYKLKAYFAEAYKLSVSYGPRPYSAEPWQQDNDSIEGSTSYWPQVCLGTVTRSTAIAEAEHHPSGVKGRGLVFAVEEVYLTLGWSHPDRVIAYLECIPGIAAELLAPEHRGPYFDMRCSGEEISERWIGDLKVVIADGGSIKVPDGATGDWPYRLGLGHRHRFDPINPRRLIACLTDCQLIKTPDQTLSEDIDSAATLSPPGSPLALLEAQLLGRKSRFSYREIPCLIDDLEEDISFWKNSFQKWRQSQLERAKNDHAEQLANAVAELQGLREVGQQQNQKSDSSD